MEFQQGVIIQAPANYVMTLTEWGRVIHRRNRASLYTKCGLGTVEDLTRQQAVEAHLNLCNGCFNTHKT